jgi:proton-dependent oligopeptide transporter, POT family
MTKHLLLEGRDRHVWLFGWLKSMLHASDNTGLATAIVGLYGVLVYVTPVFGGLIADTITGKRTAVIAGASLMALGHFLMAFEQSFLFALAAIILGSGLFKGNLASQVGGLYSETDPRRPDAFQIYYIAIQIAVIVAPAVTGFLGEKVAWHFGFGAAGVGMLIAIFIYLSGSPYLPEETPRIRLSAGGAGLTSRDVGRVVVLLALIPLLALMAVPNQAIFGAYLIWGDKAFALDFFGLRVPAETLVSLDAIFSTSSMVAVVMFYRWFGKRWAEPDEFGKIAIGGVIVLIGVGFLVLAAATQPPGGKINLLLPMGFHLFNSIGLAHVFPIGLSLFARLAPVSARSTMVSVYSLWAAAANAVSGYIGGYLTQWGATDFWLLNLALAAASGAVFIVLAFTLAPRLRDA